MIYPVSTLSGPKCLAELCDRVAVTGRNAGLELAAICLFAHAPSVKWNTRCRRIKRYKTAVGCVGPDARGGDKLPIAHRPHEVFLPLGALGCDATAVVLTDFASGDARDSHLPGPFPAPSRPLMGHLWGTYRVLIGVTSPPQILYTETDRNGRNPWLARSDSVTIRRSCALNATAPRGSNTRR